MNHIHYYAVYLDSYYHIIGLDYAQFVTLVRRYKEMGYYKVLESDEHAKIALCGARQNILLVRLFYAD